ncbi:MAG: hypothetical protein F9K24_20805 [Leptonema illini]|uniref:Uncharacterized protein n=1 Tax=Leptonema illini TaxID=183 RepID=A0A833GXH1_9LEPT|nr:MAG: hypothetical protein F9K24_20805 [Leptonema illini]
MKPPKLKKLPEPPKNQTLSSMQRYVERLEEVQSENAERWQPYQDYLNELDELKKKAETLRRQFNYEKIFPQRRKVHLKNDNRRKPSPELIRLRKEQERIERDLAKTKSTDKKKLSKLQSNLKKIIQKIDEATELDPNDPLLRAE